MGIASRRTLIALAALLGALALSGLAGAATSASAELTKLASAVRGSRAHVAVYCANSDADWEATLAAHHAPPYVVGFAYLGFPRIWLSASICSGVPRADPWAVLVFLHELGHTSGIRAESAANCFALTREEAFLERYLALAPDQAQAVYAQSRNRAMQEPASYRPTTC